MYRAGAINTYVYPPYHFALALVSRASGLDPVVVYLGFRPAAALLALLAMRSLAAALFGHPWTADLSILLWLVLVATNAAGQVPRYFWAQLVPLSHLGDFGLGIVYPLLLLLTFRFLAAPRSWWGLAVPFLAAALLVHTREVLQLLVFLFAATAYALTTGDRAWRRRLAALVAAVVALGLGYKALHSGLATHAVLFEAANREVFRAQLHEVLRRPVMEVLGEPNPARYRLLARGVFLLPLLALPALWLVRRPWARLAAPGLLTMALVVRIPYLTFPFILATYAEMLQTPARYFVHWGYLLLGSAYAVAVLVLARLAAGARGRARSRAGRAAATGGVLAAAVATGAALVLLLRGLEAIAVAAVDALYAFAIVGSIVALAVRWRRGRSLPDVAMPLTARPGWIALPVALAAALPFVRYDYPPTLREQHAEWRRLPSRADFWDWYAATDYAALVPGSVLRFLREQVPPGRVIAAPNRFAYAIPVFTNHHIVSWGYFLSTELDVISPYESVTGLRRAFPADPVQGYLQRARYAQEVIERQPLFSAAVPPEQTLAFLDAYGAEYVVAGPLQRPRYERLAGTHPDRLEPLLSKRDFGVFRVRGTAGDATNRSR